MYCIPNLNKKLVCTFFWIKNRLKPFKLRKSFNCVLTLKRVQQNTNSTFVLMQILSTRYCGDSKINCEWYITTSIGTIKKNMSFLFKSVSLLPHLQRFFTLLQALLYFPIYTHVELKYIHSNTLFESFHYLS